MELQITAITDPLRAWIVKKKSTVGPIAGAVALLWIIARLQAHVAARSNSSKLPSPKFALPYFGKSRHVYFDLCCTNDHSSIYRSSFSFRL